MLINNAGILIRDNLASSMTDQFVVNAVAPLLLTQKLLPNLIEKGAFVVFVSSKMGSVGSVSSSNLVGYRMSKAACNMGAITLSKTLPNHCVVVLHPGVVQTDMCKTGYQVTPSESVTLLRKLLLKLNNLESGKFWDVITGETLPW
jgi:NAD(P)-dependent dehydrogenase (short-subunit alcohol dehydrogenase family)